MIIVWFFYNLIMLLGFFLYWPWAALKGKHPAGFWARVHGVREADAVRLAGHPVVWIHAVSVGEAQAMQPFLKQLQAHHPAWRVVLTTITSTGQQIARTLLGSEHVVAYAPLDVPWAVRYFLDRVQPKLFLAVETELWPNTLRALRDRGIPAIIVNGRLSPRSFAGYRRARRFLQPLLSRVELFLMQTPADAERLRALGVPDARIRVAGNLKWDGIESDSVPAGLKQLQRALGLDEAGLLLVAGSTHPGEEEPVLRVFQRVASDIPQLRCLVAPRHIERTAEVSHKIRRLGLEPVTYSDLTSSPLQQRLRSNQVVLVDTIGHLRHLYALATIAYVGGSLVPKGGHNPLEPAQFGKPILTGPHLTNFRAITETLNLAGGLRVVSDAFELETALRLLLTSPQTRLRMGQKARSVIQANQGAVARTLDAIQPVLAHWSHPPQPYTIWERGPHAYHWMHRVMDDEPGGFGLKVSRAAVTVLSLGYAAVVRLWDLSYRHHWARVHRASCPVISIGNLTLGGTGKSACVLWLTQRLKAKGLRPAIVTRGYGRRAHDGPGDEPAMFLRELGDVPVLVGWDRARSARWAVERARADVIVLDDGFQHRRLHRDVDLLTVDAARGWGAARLLPRGRLREPLTAIARARALIVTKTNLAPRTRPDVMAQAQAINPQLLLARADHAVRGLLNPVTPCEEPATTLRGRRVAALSSIGDPAAFEQLLMQTGAIVGLAVRFPDHYRYRARDLQRLERELAACELTQVVTTQKDWMRLGPQVASLGRTRLTWRVLQMQFNVDDADAVVDRLLGLLRR